MSDQELKKLIQQSRAIQGYLSYTPAQLEQALGGWKKGLEEIPAEDRVAAINAAMVAYQTGPFNPAYVRKIYNQSQPEPKLPEDIAILAIELLSKEVVKWPAEGSGRMNILKPIADWIEKRPLPRRQWEEDVLNACVETEDRPA